MLHLLPAFNFSWSVTIVTVDVFKLTSITCPVLLKMSVSFQVLDSWYFNHRTFVLKYLSADIMSNTSWAFAWSWSFSSFKWLAILQRKHILVPIFVVQPKEPLDNFPRSEFFLPECYKTLKHSSADKPTNFCMTQKLGADFFDKFSKKKRCFSPIERIKITIETKI